MYSIVPVGANIKSASWETKETTKIVLFNYLFLLFLKIKHK